MDLTKITCLAFSFLFLSGCASSGFMRNRTATGGVGSIYEPRGQKDDMPVIRFSINVHFENRPDDNTLDRLGEALKNITGIPQAVVTALTSPERTVETVVGSDRREIHIPFEIDASKHSTVAVKMNIGKKIQEALKKNDIDATVTVGNKEKGINLEGITIEIIKTDEQKIDAESLSFEKVKDKTTKNQ